MTINITPSGTRKHRPLLIVTRGLPGSGKSTAAIAWVRADQDWRTRINRDDLRDMGHGRRLGTQAQEAIVTGMQTSAVRTALSHGTSVVVDDTNLPEHVIEAWSQLAADLEADFEVWDFRDIDVEVCIARDALRDGDDCVGEQVIRGMHEKYIRNSRAAATVPVRTRAMGRG